MTDLRPVPDTILKQQWALPTLQSLTFVCVVKAVTQQSLPNTECQSCFLNLFFFKDAKF